MTTMHPQSEIWTRSFSDGTYVSINLQWLDSSDRIQLRPSWNLEYVNLTRDTLQDWIDARAAEADDYATSFTSSLAVLTAAGFAPEVND